MKQSEVFLKGKEITEEVVGEGVKRQILGYNEDVMLVIVDFETGSIGDVHSHPHVQTSYIESGRFEVTIDGDKQELVAGDGFFVPSGKPHGVICLAAGKIIDTFSPMREDFL